ncbi:MAG: histidinol-phosphate transaminase [Xanthomonadales bacterium]|nr:histidinol-phosphate transaminase [Gammaproteobacteria bacterium]MBT8054323.1 histidinol-phosphate transaminase [Gammaproteobacteria bacterium]NND57484.1 histidinol-phosphate transaminase [Xanthomonadales bacterium]NNK51208.1 histidinol-phosphate transaminase [Xanthomonadales bacterium]
MGIEDLARPEIVAMKPYSSARKEAPGQGILLNANEAPRPLLSQPGRLNRYPEPQPAELVARLASLYDVRPDQILVTRGSDEGIDLLVRVFCRAGQDAIMQCPPTFGMYRIAARTQGADTVSVLRSAGQEFKLDQESVLEAFAGDSRIKLVFLTSPNNPTGDSIGRDFLRRLLELSRNRAIVVLDEAYIEFCASPSASDLIAEYENLVVLRTMSKAWAAAGLRCGSVLAQSSVIALLQRVIAPYPLPSPVLSLALRMLDETMLEQQQLLMQEIRENKGVLIHLLDNRKFIRQVIPGDANFVLVAVDDAAGLLSYCARKGVILRGFPADPLLQNYLRISVGSKPELEKLASVFDAWENGR